jgi:uncharacterized phiE125 gp8 family phage protein
MALRLITAPKYSPVSLDEIKRNSAIPTTQTDYDDLLRVLRDSAVARVEAYLGRALVESTWKMHLQSWSGPYPYLYGPGCIILPLGRLISVTHVKYTDVDETQSTWSSDEYDVDTDSDPGRICVAYGESFPSAALYPTKPIEIQFVCGWYTGDAWVAETAYASGDIAIPDTYADSTRNLAYDCTTAGTTGETAPTWPTTIGGTVEDGTAVWTARERVPASIRQALLLAIDDAFQHRGDLQIGAGLTETVNLRAAEALLSRYRLWRF